MVAMTRTLPRDTQLLDTTQGHTTFMTRRTPDTTQGHTTFVTGDTTWGHTTFVTRRTPMVATTPPELSSGLDLAVLVVR